MLLDLVFVGAILVAVVGSANVVVQALLPFAPKAYAKTMADLAYLLPSLMMALALGVVGATVLSGALAFVAPYVMYGVSDVVKHGEKRAPLPRTPVPRALAAAAAAVAAARVPPAPPAPPAADKPPSLSERTFAAAIAVPVPVPTDI